MPQAVADGEQPAPVVACEGRIVPVEVGDVGEGRGQPVVLRGPQARTDGMLEVAQALGEGELLGIVDLLVVEHEDRVGVHAGMDGGHLRGRERLTHVETVDLGGEGGAERADGERHVGAPGLRAPSRRRPGCRQRRT